MIGENHGLHLISHKQESVFLKEVWMRSDFDPLIGSYLNKLNLHIFETILMAKAEKLGQPLLQPALPGDMEQQPMYGMPGSGAIGSEALPPEEGTGEPDGMNSNSFGGISNLDQQQNEGALSNAT